MIKAKLPAVVMALLFAMLVESHAMAIEKAPYKLLAKSGAFELRQYQPHIVAATVVEGEFEKVGSEGFRRLADYINGNNRRKQSITMTAPVGQENSSQKIAMTAPVKGQPQTRPDRPASRWRMRPALVAGLAFILVIGALGATELLFRGDSDMTTAAFTCPPGSTPDQLGPPDQPRPPFVFDDNRMTFDPGSGRALMLNEPGLFWMFDVCTNTWTKAPRPGEIGFNTWTAEPRPGEIGLVTDLVYDVDSGRAVAFAQDREAAQVWAFDPDRHQWTRKSNLTVGPALLQAVYDPVTGLVVVRANTSQLWTYDVDTDTWSEVDQGATLPPAVEDGDAQLLTYDASADRLILYLVNRDEPNSSFSTWEFDIRAGHWEKQATNTPSLGIGWWPSADGFIYDGANQVSVIYGRDPYVATYDALEHSWTVAHGSLGFAESDADEPALELFEFLAEEGGLPGAAMTYDPVNERILVLGGQENGVFAFNVATGEWITLLEPAH